MFSGVPVGKGKESEEPDDMVWLVPDVVERVWVDFRLS